jgi:hypothetical protein
MMKRYRFSISGAGLVAGLLVAGTAGAPHRAAAQQVDRASVFHWNVHDRNRPAPPKVDPGTASTPEQPGKPPSDAIVLFDGSGFANWEQVNGGGAPGWTVQNGYMQIVPKSGSIQTKQGFGDVQLHVEWASPDPPTGEDQTRGNSGVYIMGNYEVQVLNSSDTQTYPDGQASALYGQYPPLVNASRAPGQWQTYDIVFHRPRFDESQQLVAPARVTVFHNGVLVHDNVELTGPTTHQRRPPYAYHAARLPLQLQDHGDSAVRYRNIWVRDLEKK